MNNTTLIGIAGGSGSGKSTFAQAIASNYNEKEVVIIEQDSYYNDFSNYSLDER